VRVAEVQLAIISVGNVSRHVQPRTINFDCDDVGKCPMEAQRSTTSESYPRITNMLYSILNGHIKAPYTRAFYRWSYPQTWPKCLEKKLAPTSVLLLEAEEPVGSSSSFNLRVVDVLNRLFGRIPQCFQGLRTKGRRLGLTSSRLQVQEAREEAEHKACRCCVSRGSALRLMEDSARAAMVRQGALALAVNKESIDAEAFACLRSR
jgi:hypothetical protein